MRTTLFIFKIFGVGIKSHMGVIYAVSSYAVLIVWFLAAKKICFPTE
jgi:hypothetical protein